MGQRLKQKGLEFPLLLRVGKLNIAVIVAAAAIGVVAASSTSGWRGRVVVEDGADFCCADAVLRAHGRGELQPKRLLLQQKQSHRGGRRSGGSG